LNSVLIYFWGENGFHPFFVFPFFHLVFFLSLVFWSASPNLVWSWRLVVREPSCFLIVLWHGEALYGLGVRDVRVLLLPGVLFSAKCDSIVSARFLIYRAHSDCFLPLVSILDPLLYLFKIVTSFSFNTC
jgi:hypothetical protein